MDDETLICVSMQEKSTILHNRVVNSANICLHTDNYEIDYVRSDALVELTRLQANLAEYIAHLQSIQTRTNSA